VIEIVFIEAGRVCSKGCNKGKGKVVLRIGHEGPEGE
jgi:hypothetical protein